MPQRLHVEDIRLRRVDLDKRAALVEELFPLAARLFRGLTRADFEDYFDLVANRDIFIRVYREANRRPAGFALVRETRLTLAGRAATVLRSAAGLERAYRGTNATLLYGFRLAFRSKLRHPTERVYFFSAMLHPSSYAVFAKYAARMWPAPRGPVPPRALRIIADAAERMGYEIADPRQPLVCRHPRAIRITDAERQYWIASSKPSARFFLATNPRFDEGYGLLTLIPVTWPNIVVSLTRYATTTGTRGLQRVWHATRLRLLGRRRMSHSELQRTLAHTTLFSTLDAPTIHRLARTAVVEAVPSATEIVRQGDAADALYVLLAGKAEVIVEERGTRIIVAEVERGEVIGEMGLLADQPRSATVRALMTTQLLRIRRADFERILDPVPEIRERVWRTFAKRTFENRMLSTRSPSARPVDFDEWFETGHHVTLPSGTTHRFTPDRLAFVYRGTLEVGGELDTIAAPALVPLGAALSVMARSDARIVEFPIPDWFPT